MAFDSSEKDKLLGTLPIIQQTMETPDPGMLENVFIEYNAVVLPDIIKVLEQVKTKGVLSANSNFRSTSSTIPFEPDHD